MLERLSVHHELVQEVKLLLDRPVTSVELFEAILYEYFHLLVSQKKLIHIVTNDLAFKSLSDGLLRVYFSNASCRFDRYLLLFVKQVSRSFASLDIWCTGLKFSQVCCSWRSSKLIELNH